MDFWDFSILGILEWLPRKILLTSSLDRIAPNFSDTICSGSSYCIPLSVIQERWTFYLVTQFSIAWIVFLMECI